MDIMAEARIKNKKLAKIFNHTNGAKTEKLKAIHEAGHRFVQWVVSARCNDVSVMSGKTKYTGRDYDGIARALMSDSNQFNAPMVYNMIAGRAAVEALMPKTEQGFSYMGDFKVLSKLYSLDDETIEMHKWRKEYPVFNTEAFYQRFKKPLIKQFRSRRGRKAIKALSDALLKYGTISGQESIKILEKSYGPPYPLGALPASDHCEVTDGPPKCFNDCMNTVNILTNAIRETVMPLRDDEKNSKHQNAILEKIYNKLLFLHLLSSPDENKIDKPS
ncbi:MAG: hypothetical protein WAW09_08535 [Smithella sp.]